ncbi:MAG TPA: nucleoside-diphosphate kinase [Bdellovibrionales bacterium]|nr:MAG: nucleoside-diphosphate kinase [Bdellovibrionales bacterium GWB1_52_6]OFZ06096.1 MAG: nucleoside-diphosphate kinase [Bdellovibrionales bacterium GWA1_52_35]OFZ38683.1 MAG: nucleoside-diphosphate kinase [Bdellovibrionales bacterium GWC1_52_8]HAR42993.1 nucleoside-diphosphate kinase [Bdellovibrionales bacterium]HCM39276.1 nucleoside-diphosphate kinase [Bdellovibrionales bacterium]
MANERTFSIIKPNAVEKNVIGEIITRFEKRGLRIAAAKFVHLSREKAEGFYIEHQAKPFFQSLIRFMTSGPVLLMCLEGENAVLLNREIMGATDPAKAAPGTIRKDFADSMEANAVHGSDSPKSAERELAYFFEKSELYKRY